MASTTHEVFARLFTSSAEALRNYVLRFVRSRETADEIVQEAFLRTYERAAELDRPIDTPRALLFHVARNLAFGQLRHERVSATDLVGDFGDSGVVDGGDAIEDQLIADEASRLLKEAVDQLPPQCQAAFALKVFHGHSYREIGERLGVAEKTVEKHIARGLLKTHRYMRERYGQVHEAEPAAVVVSMSKEED